MDGSQDILASSINQQISKENIAENANCNICTRTFHMNCGLLQHLNFSWRRNITNNDNQTITTIDANNDNTNNSNNSIINDISDKTKSQENFYLN